MSEVDEELIWPFSRGPTGEQSMYQHLVVEIIRKSVLNV